MVAAHVGGEGGEVEGLEGGSCGGEEGDDCGGAFAGEGGLEGGGVAAVDGEERERVLGDEEFEDGAVGVVASSVVKRRALTAGGGDGEEAPLVRIKLGLRNHQLRELKRSRAAADAHELRPHRVVLEEHLVHRGGGGEHAEEVVRVLLIEAD